MKAWMIMLLLVVALVLMAVSQLPIAGWVDGFRVH